MGLHSGFQELCFEVKKGLRLKSRRSASEPVHLKYPRRGVKDDFDAVPWPFALITCLWAF